MACSICGGANNEEHKGRQHVYTEKPGDLRAPEAAKASPQPMIVRLPGAQTNEAQAVGRLVEVMMDKGLLSDADALYVMGVGQKPAQQSGYKDPAVA